MDLNAVLAMIVPEMWAGSAVLVAFLTLVQISPVKLNPWDKVFE